MNENKWSTEQVKAFIQSPGYQRYKKEYFANVMKDGPFSSDSYLFYVLGRLIPLVLMIQLLNMVIYVTTDRFSLGQSVGLTILVLIATLCPLVLRKLKYQKMWQNMEKNLEYTLQQVVVSEKHRLPIEDDPYPGIVGEIDGVMDGAHMCMADFEATSIGETVTVFLDPFGFYRAVSSKEVPEITMDEDIEKVFDVFKKEMFWTPRFRPVYQYSLWEGVTISMILLGLIFAVIWTTESYAIVEWTKGSVEYIPMLLFILMLPTFIWVVFIEERISLWSFSKYPGRGPQRATVVKKYKSLDDGVAQISVQVDGFTEGENPSETRFVKAYVRASDYVKLRNGDTIYLVGTGDFSNKVKYLAFPVA